MNKTIRLIIVTLCMMLPGVGGRLLAEITQVDGVYQIGSAKDLLEFADIVNGTNGQTQNLAAKVETSHAPHRHVMTCGVSEVMGA